MRKALRHVIDRGFRSTVGRSRFVGVSGCRRRNVDDRATFTLAIALPIRAEVRKGPLG